MWSQTFEPHHIKSVLKSVKPQCRRFEFPSCFALMCYLQTWQVKKYSDFPPSSSSIGIPRGSELFTHSLQECSTKSQPFERFMSATTANISLSLYLE